MAMGSHTSLIGSSGSIVTSNGTSFSTPILAGMGACLWEALPELTSFEIISLLRETAHQYSTPDPEMGYGIADVYKAYSRAKTGLTPAQTENRTYLFVNLSENRLYINLDASQNYARSSLNIYSGLGMCVLNVSRLSDSIDISFLPQGIYIARLQIGDTFYVRKFIKL
jgi:subtilase family serine protease